MDAFEDMPKPDTLPPAAALDRDAAAAALMASDEAWRLEDLHGIPRTMLVRAADALHPHLSDLAFRARAGTLAGAGDVTVRPIAFPTPWHVGFALERPGEPGYLYAVALEVPMDGNPTIEAMLDAGAEAARARHAAEGLAGEALDRTVLTARIMASLKLEEDLLAGRIPFDLPPPAGGEPVERVHVIRYAPAPGPAPAGEDFLSYAARLRPATGAGLDAAVAAVASDGYARDVVLKTYPSRPDHRDRPDGPWDPPSFSTVEASIADWAGAFGRLRAVAGPAGLLPAIAAASRDVAGRRYVTYADEGIDRTPDEIGSALAALDGGLPGPDATAWLGAFEGRVWSRRYGALAEELGRLSEGLATLGRGHGAALDYNDLDNTVSTTLGEAGPEALTLTEQNGQYVVVLDRDGAGAVSGIGLARYGLPFARYFEDGRDPRDPEALGYRAFHRDYANPRDPHAPVPWDEARDRLGMRGDGFPGFLARFERGPEGFACTAMGPYDARTVRDVNNLAHDLQGAMLAVREDLEAAAAPRP